jgi:CRISPR-associated protein Cas2
MYYIIVYDIGEERVSRVCKCLRKFLTWVQNSVFEGELTEGQMLLLQSELREIIDRNTDSIIFYNIPDKKWIQREVFGQERNPTDNVL